MSLPARILACLLALVVAFSFGWGTHARFQQRKALKLALEAEQEARRIEQKRAAMQQEIQDAKDRELRRVHARLADALERLRNRPERLPEPARTACAGSTGAELSGTDAAFLVREAARADSLRAELAACQAREVASRTAATP